jgi:hypothetical protein
MSRVRSHQCGSRVSELRRGELVAHLRPRPSCGPAQSHARQLASAPLGFAALGRSAQGRRRQPRGGDYPAVVVMGPALAGCRPPGPAAPLVRPGRRWSPRRCRRGVDGPDVVIHTAPGGPLALHRSALVREMTPKSSSSCASPATMQLQLDLFGEMIDGRELASTLRFSHRVLAASWFIQPQDGHAAR